MAVILNINTAFEKAQLTLSNNKIIIEEAESDIQKNHASFLEPAIQRMCNKAQLSLQTIDAVAVVNGPGSYTGLRVGLASAKALCYALNKPLILLNTLDVMAHALKQQAPVQVRNVLFCPLIDARRMEVYTALYDNALHLLSEPAACIIDKNFLRDRLTKNIIVAGGNGSSKLKTILEAPQIIYAETLNLLKPAIFLAEGAFTGKLFANVAYSEPFYLKPFYSVK